MGKRKTDRKRKRTTGRSMEFNRLDDELNRLPKEGHGFIYRYTFNNGKCYIGQTIRTIKERTINHTESKMLVDRVMKSGAKFIADILAEVPYDYMDAAERYCILKFKTLVPNGYNMDAYNHTGIRIVPDEVRKKVSEGVKRALADPIKGKRMRSVSDHQRFIFEKSVMCLETGKRYRSATIAAKNIGCTMGNISACINKYEYTHTAKGYHFVRTSKISVEYREELLSSMKQFEDELHKISRRKACNTVKKRYPNDYIRPGSISVRCIETGIVYKSIHHAGTSLNIGDWNISKNIKGQIENAKGYHFERAV